MTMANPQHISRKLLLKAATGTTTTTAITRRSLSGLKKTPPSSTRRCDLMEGSCLCGDVTWTLRDVAVGQVLVCHCGMCRRISGSTNVPFVAVCREPFMSQLNNFLRSGKIKKYQSSDSAARYSCSTCSSFLCMEYLHEEGTLWIPLGSLTSPFDLPIDAETDSQIFSQDKVVFHDKLGQLQHLPDFGTYISDVCNKEAQEE